MVGYAMDNRSARSDIKRGLSSSNMDSMAPPNKLIRTPGSGLERSLNSPNLSNPLLATSSTLSSSRLFPGSSRTSSGLTSTSSTQLIASKRNEMIENAQKQRQGLALTSSLLANSSLRKESRLHASSLTSNRLLSSSYGSSLTTTGTSLKSSILQGSSLLNRSSPGYGARKLGGTSALAANATSQLFAGKKDFAPGVTSGTAGKIPGQEENEAPVLGPDYQHLFKDTKGGFEYEAEDFERSKTKAGEKREKFEKMRKKIQDLKVCLNTFNYWSCLEIGVEGFVSF